MVFHSRASPEKRQRGPLPHSATSEDATVHEKEQDSEPSIELPHLQHQLGHESGGPGIAISRRPSEAAQGLAAEADAWHGSGRWYQVSTLAYMVVDDT